MWKAVWCIMSFVQEVHCTWMHLCYYNNKFLNWDTATPLILIHNLRENISVCCSTIVMFMCTAHTSFSSQVHRFPNSIRIKWLWLGCQPFLHCLPLLMCHSDVIWVMLILWPFQICWSDFSLTCMHIESPPKLRLKLSAHFWNTLHTHKHSSAHIVITILNCYFSKNKWS